MDRWGILEAVAVYASKPVQYAYEWDGEKVREWLETTYPAIQKQTKGEKADSYRADETTVKARDVRGCGYALRGKTPVVNRTEQRECVSMVSTATNRGKIYWKLHEGSINGEKFKEFAERLVYGNKRKVLLIMDNAKTHHGKRLSGWAAENKKRVALFYSCRRGLIPRPSG